MKEIVMVTGNMGKWEIARDIFANYNINLKQEKVDTPEIQSHDVEDVSLYSAEYAANKLNKAVIKSDVGYYIEELGGFPGPFLRYANDMLKSENILKIMEGKENRTLILKECLTYAEPGEKSVKFVSKEYGTIALKQEGVGSTFDQILILKGFDKPKGTYSKEINFEHFKNNLQIYHQIAKYLEKTEKERQ